MSAPPIPEEDSPTTRAALEELIAVGMTLAREIAAATPAAAGNPKALRDLATAYERVARAIRRTILLIELLAKPTPAREPARTPAPAPSAPARPGFDRPPLGTGNERLDRLESVDGIPTHVVVAEIRRDLGLAATLAPREPRPAAPAARGQGPHSQAHRTPLPRPAIASPLRPNPVRAPDTG